MTDVATVSTSVRPSRNTPEVVARAAAEAFEIGVRAYLWGFPLVIMARTRDLFTDPSRPGGAPVNRFHHGDRLWDHRDRAVVKPNNDTLYSVAWLDLSGEPVTLTVPAVPRYYSFQFLDAYTNTWAYVGSRETGSGPGRFAVVGPDWRGSVPDGTRLLRAPTAMTWLIGRTLLDDAADLPTASALIRTFELDGPESGAARPAAAGPAPSPHTIGEAGIGFFDELSAALTGNPPPAEDAELLARLGELGIGPGRVPSTEITDELVRGALTSAVEVAHAWLVGHSGPRRGPQNPVWPYNLGIGDYGSDHTLRAVIALRGLGALTAEEAVYSTTGHDGAGERFDGRNSYTLHFPAADLPPVDGFWSLTLYDEDDFLAANPIDRYSIGDRTTGLKYEEDGSLTIVIAHERPAPGVNWLPAPAAPFELTLRCYLPQQRILTGEYVIPPVVRR